MPKKLNLKKTLKRCDDADLPDNVIGIAYCETDHGPHAGIFIRDERENLFFHYNGENILLENMDDVGYNSLVIFKEFKLISTNLIPSIRNQCEIVLQNAQPRYGYFYAGAQYNSDGDFISPGDMPEYMTCVGFCLSFLKYCLYGMDFIAFQDWDITSADTSFVDAFLKRIEKYYSIDVEEVKKYIRRILPIEYLTAAYQNTTPVRKSFTDLHHPKINSVAKKKLAA